MVHKTLINKKAKSYIAKILTSAETDNYHLMSRLTTRTTPARISLVDFYWLNYWDTMVNLDRWVIIACIDIEMILANHFSSKFDFYWLLVHPQVFKAHGDQIRVFRHWKSLFNFDKTSKYRFLIEKCGFNFLPIRACSNTKAISVFHTYHFMSANKNKWIYYLPLSIKLPITGFII